LSLKGFQLEHVHYALTIADKITSWEQELNAPQRIRNIKAHFNVIFPQRTSATKEDKRRNLLHSKEIADTKAP